MFQRPNPTAAILLAASMVGCNATQDTSDLSATERQTLSDSARDVGNTISDLELTFGNGSQARQYADNTFVGTEQIEHKLQVAEELHTQLGENLARFRQDLTAAKENN